jgi:class 3 adenylate cyclase
VTRRTIERRSFTEPDLARSFPHGSGAVARVGALAVGRAALEPGWRWSADLQPTVGTPSCPSHHLHVLLAGRFAVQMDGADAEEFAPGDVFDVPPGHDAWVVGDTPVVLLDLSGNVADFGLPTAHGRVLATILFTDIVSSTPLAERLGDAGWKQLLGRHDRVVRAALERFRGREVDTTGDGFLATFDSAVGAVRAAQEIAATMHAVEVEVRVGIHTGEIELLPDDARGLAIHVAARVMAEAAPSEVLVTAVTRTLVDDPALTFESAGVHQLKGLAQPVELYRLTA